MRNSTSVDAERNVLGASERVGEWRAAREMRRAALLAGLRIYLGIIFLVAVWPKLTADTDFAVGLERFVAANAARSAHGFYRPFLESIVLTHAGVFAALVRAGELAVGLALLTGTATRLAAGAAMLMTLNYMLAKGMWLWTPASNDAALFVIAVSVLLGAAGRPFGVDAVLVRRFPRLPRWW